MGKLRQELARDTAVATRLAAKFHPVLPLPPDSAAAVQGPYIGAVGAAMGSAGAYTTLANDGIARADQAQQQAIIKNKQALEYQRAGSSEAAQVLSSQAADLLGKANSEVAAAEANRGMANTAMEGIPRLNHHAGWAMTRALATADPNSQVPAPVAL